jgi:alpha-glucuronidase
MKYLLLIGAVFVSTAVAETGHDAWLRYEPITDAVTLDLYRKLPASILRLGDTPILHSSEAELARGIQSMLQRHSRFLTNPAEEDSFVLGRIADVKRTFPSLTISDELPEDGFILKSAAARGHNMIVVAASNDRGVLYGTFALLRQIALRRNLGDLNLEDGPYAPVRWVNQWDNLDGSIERGYAGRSIFFDDGNVVADLTRAGEYARLLASIGINGCTINNVNANPRMLSPEFLPQLVRVAEAFRPWGIRLAISVPFASPKTAGGLATFDPVDPQVAAWWKAKVDEIYRAIPDFAGLLVKADSEGQAGPSTYNRTHAEAANVLARALAPHGGVLVYRGFVYNHHMDWRDLKNDRARAAYDNFHPLDGKFAANAAVQVKYGPIDFQAREPVSPLIGGLQNTNQILELQITQEYTGQQRHLCYLVPMWKQMLDFDLHVNGSYTPVKDIVAGRTFHRPVGGFAGVANVGLNANWLGYDLAQANLYGFGRLAWNPNLSAREITDEWTRLTWGSDETVVQVISQLVLESWQVYEGYTGPLGLQTMTDILHGHYGPGIETAERNGWGQWIRANHEGIGMDRTVATGTGYTGQYSPEVMRLYESLATCPDELLLFMHHLPYTFKLHSGKTIVQSVYDGHYAAAAEAQEFPRWWETLRGRVDEPRFQSVLDHLQYQAGHAIVWRDAICQWFERMSGITDLEGRIEHDSYRHEAETMRLDGYKAFEITPWEDSSGGKAVSCDAQRCQASLTFKGSSGWHDLSVQYFDVNNGSARFQLFVNNQAVSEWLADADLPGKLPNGDTSRRKVVPKVALHDGDTIRLEATPQGGDKAAVDYIEIVPTAN